MTPDPSLSPTPGRLTQLLEWIKRDRRESDKVLAYVQEARALASSSVPPAGLSEEVLSLLVAVARKAATQWTQNDPQPGDLVVEVTRFDVDPDAIGWLVGHDLAPYGENDPTDGSVPMREVWDVRPLNPAAKVYRGGYQRWENARFVALPDALARLASGTKAEQ